MLQVSKPTWYVSRHATLSKLKLKRCSAKRKAKRVSSDALRCLMRLRKLDDRLHLQARALACSKWAERERTASNFIRSIGFMRSAHTRRSQIHGCQAPLLQGPCLLYVSAQSSKRDPTVCPLLSALRFLKPCRSPPRTHFLQDGHPPPYRLGVSLAAVSDTELAIAPEDLMSI